MYPLTLLRSVTIALGALDCVTNENIKIPFMRPLAIYVQMFESLAFISCEVSRSTFRHLKGKIVV